MPPKHKVKNKPSRYSIVEVLWKDASSSGSSWDKRKGATRPLIWVATVGYVLKWGKGRITLCQSVNPSQVGKVTSIPRSGIRAWRILGLMSDKNEVWEEGDGRRGK